MMAMARTVAAESLDRLDADDPTAVRSRRDLRRLHRVMGTRSILLHALSGWAAALQTSARLRILELGAGDGSLMLGVARSIAPAWPPVELTLLDRRSLVSEETTASFADLGWTAVASVADVFAWAATQNCTRSPPGASAPWDLIVANLFMHHFAGAQLASLLGAIAVGSDRFLACEPRRGRLALAGSHLVGALGANAVTRDDAVLSVRAGFRGTELTAAWPPPVGTRWHLREQRAGLFSHVFSALRGGAI